MSRPCVTLQHIHLAEINRRLAVGEPQAHIAAVYGINPASLYRHRVKCAALPPTAAVTQAATRGTVALASLPSRDEIGSAYDALRVRIDQIVAQAEAQGSLAV